MYGIGHNSKRLALKSPVRDVTRREEVRSGCAVAHDSVRVRKAPPAVSRIGV
jgi:hypothetical protein